jgi:1,4-alpha-glucan branching enzyme
VEADDVIQERVDTEAFRRLGAHLTQRDGISGVRFAVWAPNAERVSVIGDMNGWNKDGNPLHPLGESGVWEGFVPGVGPGTAYKYHVVSRYREYRVDKADPFGFRHETPPGTASIVWDLDYEWNDAGWMEDRGDKNAHSSPISIYEVHLGSWRRSSDRALTYRGMAAPLADYVLDLGFTHVEFLPLTEHPFYGSWGYQTTGYFAPTSRYGTPQDFMFLVDTLHRRGIGVILDWVPSHFPNDEHGLGYFDGTHLYEHMDPRQGVHPDWKSLIFNYDRQEVQSFLIQSALFWLEKYHIDGLRVDAVASMLYVDFSRGEGEWVPNIHGGKENLGAVEFIRKLNDGASARFPDALIIAEENSGWPRVTHRTADEGLGFDMRWDLGWTHDALAFLHEPPLNRPALRERLGSRLAAFHERRVLPLSHDDVTDEKGSLLGQMYGEEPMQLAGLRFLLGLLYAQPGKKLLFMGTEFGAREAWHHDQGMDWALAESGAHSDLKAWVRELNRLYRGSPELHRTDSLPEAFAWVDQGEESGVFAFLRSSKEGGNRILILAHTGSEAMEHYRVGVPESGSWKQCFTSHPREEDHAPVLVAEPVPWQGLSHSLTLDLPPLGILFLVPA